MANFNFTNAYQVNTATTPAGKEQSSVDFSTTALGVASINDSTGNFNFSGNDVSAIGINIGGVTYNGWISRPIKSGGDVRGFYFWTDPDFTTLPLAQADGNTDGDGNPYDNLGFVLVIDQAWFDSQPEISPGFKNVGSSSDRVDSALNSLLTANAAPVAVADTGTAVEAGGLNNAAAGSNATGNALTNDTDTNAGDTKAVTLVGTSSAGTTVTAGTTSANGTIVAGQYGSITIGADGSYSYVVTNSNAAIEALRTSSNTLTDRFTYTMKDAAGLTSTTTLTVTIQGANDTPIGVNDNNVAKESTTAGVSGFTSAGATATGNVLTNDTDKDSGDGKTVSGTAGTANTSSGITTNGTFKLYLPAGPGSTFNPVAVGEAAWLHIGGVGYALFAADQTTQIVTAGAFDATAHTFVLNAQPLYYFDSVTSTVKPISNLSGGLSSQEIGFKGTTLGNTITDNGMKLGLLDATTPVLANITSSTVSVGSLTIDGAIAVGMSVTGTGVPASTVITALTYDGSGNVSTITVNTQLTSTSGTTLTFAGSAGATLTGHYGTLVLNADGTYTYTPFTDITTLSSGQSGTDTFKYGLADTAGATSTATLTITVLGAGSNDPVAVADTGTATEVGIAAGSNPSGNLITNDTGTNRIVSGARSVDSSSETSILATDTTVAGRYGTLTVKQDGTWSYALDNANTTVNALNTGGTLSEVFLYRDTNVPTSTGSSVSTLTITINGADDAPVAAVDSATAIEAGGLSNANAGLDPTGNVLSNDTDVDNTAAQLSVTAIRLGGTANAGTAGTLGSALVGTYGSLTLSSTGAWTYVVDNTNAAVNALAAGGTLTDSFNYTLSDGSGGTATANALLNITIQGAADTLAINSVYVNEASPYAVFTVTGTAGIAVTLALSDTTGLAATDVKADLAGGDADIGTTLQYFNGTTWTNYNAGTPPSIPAGGQLFVRVAVVNDNVYEGNESFTLTATTTSADVTSATGIGTVNDEGQGEVFLATNNTGTPNSSGDGGYPTLDDDRPTISVSNTTIAEGVAAEFTVSIDKLSNFDIEFSPVLAAVTAALGTDTAATTALEVSTDGGTSWTAVTSTVTIAAGESSLILRLATTNDFATESTETFTLSTGYIDGVKNQSGVTGTATITDNDPAGLTISQATRTTAESGTSQSFTVKLNSQPTSDVTVTITGLDATEGSLNTTTLTFTSANWNSTQTVTVTGVDDTLDDGDIGYTLTLTSSGDAAYDGANAKTGTVAVTNTDDDAAPTLAINNVSVNEADGTATFTVTRSGATGGVTTVDYASADGTATTAGSDYTGVAGSLSFGAGETSKTITVNINNDSVDENNEAFTVVLSNIADATSASESITTATGTATITDNDTAGLTISDATRTTAESGTSQSFTVKLNSQPTSDVTVTMTGLDATEGSLNTTTLTFTSANWNSTQTVTVTGVDDTLDDGDIGYTLTLTSSGDATYDGANAKTGTVVVTNTDDDAAPTLAINDVSVNEADGTATFTVTRSGATGGVTTVDYASADGTATTAGSDYTAVTGSLSFGAGETSKTITVNINNDSIDESNEAFTVVLSNIADATSASEAITTATGTATITDNDTAGLTISDATRTTAESGTSQSFTVKLNSQPTSDVTVTITGLDATEGSLNTTTLTFTSANWNSTQTVTVTGVDDTLDDGDIGHTLTLTSSGDATYDGANAKTGTVVVTNTDDDAAPTLAINNVSVNEGDGTATFTVTRSGATGGVTTVDYASADGTATTGDSDYTGVTGSLSFGAGETSKTITVNINNDSAVEGSEAFTVVLSNIADATSASESITTATGTATITDNDTAGLTISDATRTTAESGTSQSFTVKLNTQPIADVTVTITGLDATEGSLNTTTLTFTSANWNTPQTVTVTGVDDTLDDGNIGYTLTLTSSGDAAYDGANAKTGTVAVTNTDDDAAPTLAINNVSVNEADGTATFTVTRSGATGGVTTVDYASADGTATTAGSDYTSTTGSLSFGVGETTKTITVNINNDSAVEGSEAFTVVLSNIADATSASESITTATGTATITDNDVAGLVISDATRTTAESGTSQSFTVKLSSQPTADVTVTITGLDATEGSLNTTTLTFTSANWNSTQTVTVTGVDDTLDDGNIGYTLTLTSSGDAAYDGANAKTGTVAVTNTDDDAAPTLAINNVTVNEADGTATFTVTRSGALGGTTTVDYASADGTATTAGSDYTSTTGSLSFGVGETTKTITVNINNDSAVESSEAFTMVLSNIADATSASESITTATGTATITDNDVAGLVISDATRTTAESGTSQSFTVKLSSQPTADVTVTITGLDATEGSLNTTTLTFTSANWNTPQTVTVTGVDDTLDDGSIGYTLTLTSSGDAAYDGVNAKTGTVAVTNTDDDAAPTLAINNVTVNEGDGTATFTVTRSGATGGVTTVDYASADGTATTAGSDYTGVTGSLSFGAGETTKTITVNINNDSALEGSEAFTVVLSNIADATSASESITTATGTATITDNDTAGLTISDATRTTAESGTSQSFTVKLNSQPTADVTVTITGLDSTEGSLNATTLTFTSANWNTPQTVTVTGVDDTIDDGDIGYTLTLTSSGDAAYDGANAQTGTVAVTNTDDDAAPTLAINNVTVNEADGTATFTVTRSGALGGVTTVDYASADGTATTGDSDYTGVTGSLSFGVGETSKTITVNINNDSAVEGSEAFTVVLSNIADATSASESITTATGTATITDNDSAGLTISDATRTTAESGTSQSFTVKLNSQPTADVTVTITGLDATEGSLNTTTLTFTSANWNTPQTVTVTGVDDTLDDGDIGYTLTLTSSGDAAYDGANARTGTVAVTNTDDDAAPTLAINNVSVNEADGTATFTVTRSGALGGTTTVDYASADGTATTGDSDYTGVTGSLSFGVGETSKTITVNINNDSAVEGSEAFTVVLSNIADATSASESITTATGTATITDNDAAGLTISDATRTTAESGTSQSFTVKLSSQPTADVTVTITGLDATEGSLNTTTLTFTSANWNTPQTVTVTGVDDTLDDGDIGYTLTLTSSGDAAYDGANARTGTVAVTNTDDDAAPTLAINNVSVNEGDGTATFTVTRSGATGGVTTVDYASADGTATTGDSDYTGVTGSLSFGVGETTKTITVNINNDSAAESSEAFTVVLSNIADATSASESITTATGTATITDNDNAGLTISDATRTTAESGTSQSFTVKLNSQPTSDVTVTVTGLDSTEGSLNTTTLTFTSANWNTPQTVTVTGVDDTLDDGNIGYTLTLTSSGDAAYDGANAKTGAVVVTNTDDDTAPTLAINNVSVNEAAGTATFTVTRSGALGGVTTVDYASADGTATTAGSDYTGVTGSLSFGAGETTKTITVNINNDSAAESSEAFTVVLSNIADATSASESITTATGTATITDNDSAGFTIGTVSGHTTESGGTATFTLRLNSQPTADVVVTVASSNTAEGTAATTLTFTSANWNIDQTVTVTGVDETGAQLDDGDIGYQVNLTAASGDGAYNGMTGSASVINDDNDGPPVVSIGNVSVNEGDGTATFTVTRTGTLGGTTTVDYASADGTATAGSDYTAAAGSLSFAPGETTKTITVNITNDTSVESAENFTVTLSNVADPTSPGESIGTATGTATITDNDVAAPSRTVRVMGSNDVSEGSSAVFAVTLSASSAAPTVVSLAFGEEDDSAEPADYSSGFTAYYFTSGNVKQSLAVSGGGSVTLPGGVTAFYVSVGTTGDSVYEGPEYFTLAAALSNGASDTGFSFILDDGRGRVYDDKRVPTTGTPDDDRPLITVTGADRVSEGSNAVYTVQLSTVSELPLAIALTLGGSGDSTESDDYVAALTAYYFDDSGIRHALAIVDGSVTLPAGVTTFHVSVPTTNDEPKVFEGAETLTLGAGLPGRPISTGAATIVDDGSGEVYDDTGEPTDVPTDDDRPISADLDPDDDNGSSNEDKVTSIIDPEFTVVAGTLLEEGQTVRIVAPDGSIIGTVGVTPADVMAGRVNVPSIQLDDGTYVFMAQIIADSGELVGEAPVTVTIVTDRDGVMPSVELSANGGDYNHDGVADWEQNNVAHLPLTSLADYLAGVNAPDSSFGAVMAGNLDTGAPGGAVQLDPTAQLLDLSISDAPGPIPAAFTQASPVMNFSVTSQDGATLRDIDPVRTGLQTRVVIDLPAGTLADTFIKWDADTGTWFEYLDDGDLATLDDGATLLDLDGDGLIDRVVVTLTDGGVGDEDGLANGIIVDPGMLALRGGGGVTLPTVSVPVFSVLLPGGDRFYTTDPNEAANVASGTGSVFEGVRFDSLQPVDGGRDLVANYNPITGDWYFAAVGDAMPYACYEARPGAGFQAAASGQGPGTDFHLFMNSAGQTQLVSATEAANLGLANAGFTDRGVIFNTTTHGAYAFDAEAALIANQHIPAVQAFVQYLAATYGSSHDAGFIEAVEHQYLLHVNLVGIEHGTTATAADLNTAFGTAFLS